MRSRSSQLRRNANRVILQELKKLGIKYSNMNMTQAARIVAEAHKITDLGTNKKAIAARVNPREALANTDKSKLPKRVKSKAKVIKFPAPKSTSVTEAMIKTFYDSWEWKRLSYDVKLKRGRRCECCGAKAPDVRIITDHVQPLRHYWHLRLVEANLQVLCDDCNMGKGSRDETDFRPEIVLWED
jgi:5-methylcytosine-specific restriction endonuclease McrA